MQSRGKKNVKNVKKVIRKKREKPFLHLWSCKHSTLFRLFLYFSTYY